MSHNGASALHLAIAGMTVFPCDENKRPLCAWARASTNDPHTVASEWIRRPDALIGLDCGKSDLVVIDADRHGGPDGVAAFEELCAANGGLPDGVVVSVTRGGGLHFIFRQHPSRRVGNREGALPPGINVRGAGGYIIAPGTTSDSGDWTIHEGVGALFDAYEDGTLPVIPDWILALIERDRERHDAILPPCCPSTRIHGPSDAGKRAYGQAALDAEIPDLAGCGKGGRNNLLNRVAFRLAQLIPTGCLDRSEVEAACRGACGANGLIKDDGIKSFQATLRSAIEKGMRAPRGPEEAISGLLLLPKPRRLIIDGSVAADAETGEIAEPNPHSPPWRREIDLTQCPGLVGRIADWIVSSANFQQPLLAMGAALCIVGTVAGRHLAGPTKSGTHLYVIGVAPTGAGKDHPAKSVARALMASKLTNLIGPGNLKSDSAIVNAVIRSPACVCAIDEFGAFLARGKNRGASTHEQGISAILRQLWGSSLDAVATAEKASEQFKILHSPALSIYGTSTADELYDALSDADTRNGLLNRFLVLESLKRPARIAPEIDRSAVPDEITDGLNAIYWRHGHLESSPYHGAGDVAITADPATVPWRDDEAEGEFDALQRHITAWMDDEPDNERFLVRTAEMALRIATIRAIGVDARAPSISIDDMQWGAAMAMQSAHAMIEGARDRIAENDRQKWSLRVIRVIKERSLASARDIQMTIRGALRSAEIKDILAALLEAERIELVEVESEKRGHKKMLRYRFIR